MNLSFPTFLAALLLQNSHAAKPRLRIPGSQGRGRSNGNGNGSGECSGSGGGGGAGSAVYTMTNQPDNEVLVFSRAADTGLLTFEARVPTTGNGGLGVAGDPALSSTDSIIVAGQCLLVANPGSNDVTAFRINSSSEIELMGKYESGGVFPVSIAHKEGLVYVLNAFADGAFQAFSLTQFDCGLSPIGIPVATGQQIPPTSLAASPAQIGFTPQGKLLVVIKVDGGAINIPNANNPTAPGVGSLNFYDIDPTDGTTSADTLEKIVLDDNGPTIPFAFDFDGQGRMLLVEAFNGVIGAAANGGTVSLFDGGEVLERVPLGEQASCWLRYDTKNSCAYAINTGSDTTTSLSLDPLQVVEQVAATSDQINRPIDFSLSPNGEYMYVLSTVQLDGTGQPSIFVYKTACDCGLEEVQTMADGFMTPVLPADNDGTMGVPAGLRALGEGANVGMALYPN